MPTKASINGITIAKLKMWNTQDGGGMHGDIMQDGKKIGTFYDDGWGGGTDVTIEAPAQASFNERMASYYKANPSEYPISEMFIEELVNNSENLKFYRRGLKKGFTVFALLWKAPRTESEVDGRYINQPTQIMYRSEEALKSEAVKNGFKDWQIFKTEEDFAINTMQ